jgi:hypothetical protein
MAMSQEETLMVDEFDDGSVPVDFLDENTSPPVVKPPNANTLKNIAAVAGADETVPPLIDGGFVADAYEKTARSILEVDMKDMEWSFQREAAAANVEGAMAAAQRAMELDEFVRSSRTHLENSTVVTTAAVDNLYVSSEAAVLNNNTQEASARLSAIADNITLAEYMKQKQQEDMKKYTIGGLLSGLVVEILPFANFFQMQLGVPTILEKAGFGKMSDWTGKMPSTIRQEVFNILAGLPEKEKIQAVQKIYSVIEEQVKGYRLPGTDEDTALKFGMLQEFIYKELLLDGGEGDVALEDLFFAAGLPLDALGINAIVRGGLAEARLARRLQQVMSEKAAARGVAEIKGAEAVGVDAAAVLRGEASVLDQDLADALAAALTFDLKNISPGSIRGSSSAVQADLIARTETLITEMRDLVKAGRSTEEVQEALLRTLSKYDPSVNKAIHSLGLIDDTGRMAVTWKHPSGYSFPTKESAEAFAKGKGMDEFEIVPAKGTGGWQVKEEVLDGWKAEAEELRNAIVEAFKAASKAQPTPAKKPHIKLKPSQRPAAMMDDVSGGQALSDDMDEIFGQLSWMSDLLAKKREGLDPENVSTREFLDSIEDALNFIDEAAARIELQPNLMDDVSFYEELVEAYDFAVAALGFKPQRFEAPLITDKAKAVGNTLLGPSVTKRQGEIVRSIVESLGMDDNILIITSKDMLDDGFGFQGKWQLERIINDAGSVNGLYMPRGLWDSDRAVIYLRSGKDDPKSARTLIHELGHHYDWSVLRNMDESVRAAMVKDFEAWAKNHGKLDNLPAYLKYTARFRSGVLENPQEAFAAYSTFRDSEDFRKWMTSFTEYFAEQFTKAMLTDKVPTSVLGKMFASLVAAWRRMYDAASKVLGVRFDDVDESIVAHLNQRIEDVATGNVPSGEWQGLNDSFGFNPQAMLEDTVTAQTTRLAELEALIDAAEEAKKSLATGFLVKERTPLDLDLTTLKFSDEDIESMVWLGIDPKHTASGLLVEQRYTGVHTEARIRRVLSDFMKPAIKPLSAKERLMVEDLLIKGDAYGSAGGVGKEFTSLELRAELPSNLSKKAIDRIENAYYSFRTARNALHQIRDQAMAKSLRSQGYERVSLRLSDDYTFVSAGKVSDLGAAVGTRVFDADTGKFTIITDEMANGTGRVLVETMEAMSSEKGEITRFMVTEGALTRGRITSVIPYRPGEYSRIYDDEYFVDVTRNTTRNGESTTVETTMRTARSKKEAEEYVTNMNRLLAMVRGDEVIDLAMVDRLVGPWEDSKQILDDIRSGKWDGYDSFKYHYNRTEEEFTRDYVRMSANSGKMFVDKRGAEVVSISGDRNTLKPFDSLQAEISNVSRVASITEWRDTAIARWYNTFKHLPGIRELDNGDMFDTFFRFTDGQYTGSEKLGKFAERSHKYIMRQLGVKSKEERFYEAQTRAFSERYLGEGVLQPVGRLLRKESPLQWMRTINFHTMLGMFNFAQLYVQAASAATAISIHPVHGLKAAKGAALLRMALASDNPEVWKTFAKVEQFTSLGFSNVDDFVESVKLVRKAGLLDGIKATSLYSIEEGKFNVFANMAQKSIEVGTFFFNRGEEYARLVAFLVAKAEWQDLNKGKSITSADLNTLMARTDDFTQNMSTNNKAFFQTGALSIPTQFLQFHAKLATNILTAFAGGKRGFTKKEAASLLAGHYVLFGLNGNFAPDVVKEWLGEQFGDSLSPAQRLTINEGIIAGLIAALADGFEQEAYLAVGTRTGALNFYQELVDTIMAGDATLIDTMLGVSKATMDRASRSGAVFSLWWKDPNLSSEDVLQGARALTTTWVSSLRNIDAAWYAYNNQSYFYSNSGDRIAKANSDWEIFARAIGIQSADVVDYYNLATGKRKHYDNLRNVAKEIASFQFEQVKALQRGDEQQAKEIQQIIQTLWPQNSVTDLQFVQKELRDRVYPYDTRLSKELMNELKLKTSDRAIPLTTTREP